MSRVFDRSRVSRVSMGSRFWREICYLLCPVLQAPPRSMHSPARTSESVWQPYAPSQEGLCLCFWHGIGLESVFSGVNRKHGYCRSSLHGSRITRTLARPPLFWVNGSWHRAPQQSTGRSHHAFKITNKTKPGLHPVPPCKTHARNSEWEGEARSRVRTRAMKKQTPEWHL